MANLKWQYVARGHYSAKDGDWTVHILDSGAVYKTHPTRDTVDVTGAKAGRYIESVPGKFHIRGRGRAEPTREPPEEEEEKPSAKPTPKPKPKKKKKTKLQIAAAAKKLAKGAGAIIGTTRAFVTEVGEAEERAYARRKAPAIKKKAAPKAKAKAAPKRKAAPKAKAKAAPKRKAAPKKKATPTTRRSAPPATVTDHPLSYLVGGAGALPSTRRKSVRGRRAQTLREYMGY